VIGDRLTDGYIDRWIHRLIDIYIYMER
jgi:hypothetical protein